jgi:hypothetical protein
MHIGPEDSEPAEISMSSGSVSESCCVTLCGCEEWLTAFCDYVTITLDSCGETTVFDRARFSGIKMSAVNPQSGVHPADGIFRVSMLEHSVEIALNSVITDSTGKEWVVYAIEDLASFCVKKIWARSVEACFLLLDPIEIFDLECRECDDCEDPNEYRRVGRVKGKVLAEAGSLSNRNDSTDKSTSPNGDEEGQGKANFGKGDTSNCIDSFCDRRLRCVNLDRFDGINGGISATSGIG